MRKIDFKISAADNGRRIKDYLRDFGVSSALLTKLKQTENGITVNGKFARAIDILREEDILEISVESKGHMPAPLDIPIDILYEDEDIIAVNKPPFMPVHESRNHIGDTLSNAIATHIEEDTAFRAVYRLDRDTSGIVLIAKNPLAAAKLAGKVKKDYYAIVKGEIAENGMIDAPIARLDSSIIKRGVSENGERAVTHYAPIKTNNGLTLLKINLETGKTHQIRVHFSHSGYPLLGDTLYGGDDERLNRQALHCKDIYFIHPITETAMHITCPFPDDLKKFIHLM
ncbi:MAG: RluA family pseudouridine synthase [Eubacterium sp.]|nr:RluA family pseudouridine synthase [Eubacterium sp.]